MIRNPYRINLNSLYFILMTQRLNNSPFRPNVSAREANQAYNKRTQANNQHTMGSEA
jgi:hypothetical protein